MPQVTAYKVDTLVGVKPDAIVALKVPNENKFELYITSRQGVPFPLNSTSSEIANTDGNLDISGSSAITINISDALLATINSALQSGDNISELLNDAGFITIGEVPISDEPYNATTWNNVVDEAPSKNAVRDKIESLILSGGGGANLTTTQTSTGFTITSDTGTDAPVPLGDGINAGASLNNFSNSEKTKVANSVPYTGATTDVDLGVNSITADSIVKQGGTAYEVLSADGSVLTAGNNIVISGGQISSTNGSSGGNSVIYYLNGGTISSVPTYYQMSNTPDVGVGVDFTRSGNGLLSQWLTDINSPHRLEIPAGVWNFELYLSASSNGGSPAFYVELLKYNGATFTAISDSSLTPKSITEGTTTELYLISLAIPQTTLTTTDRLALRFYVVNNISGRVITMHTQDSHLCEVITNFAGGITALNGLTETTQNFQTAETGTDFTITSFGNAHTFSIPTSSSIKRGVLAPSDWTAFNNKQDSIALTTDGTSGAATLLGSTLNIPQYSGSTNLTTTQTPTNVTIVSSSGTDATVNAVDGTNAGVVTPTQKSEWDGKLDQNTAITGATKTKITYDSKGLVTTGADLIASDIPNIPQSKVDNLTTDLAGKQPLATVLTNTTASFTTAQETKLSGIATGATANSSDVTLLARANHTGTQPSGTISDFNSATDTRIGLASINALSDVNISGLATNHTLVYDGLGEFRNALLSTTSLSNFESATRAQVESELVAGSNITITPSGSGATRQLTIASTGGGATNLDGLSDVTITTPTTNQVLKYNGSAWVNAIDSSTTTGAYTGTIVVTGTTAPTGVTNHSFAFEESNGLVELRLNIDYATSGTNITSIACVLPSGCPTPALPTGVGVAGDVLLYGVGTLSGNRSLVGGMGVCALRLKSTSPNVFEVVVTRASGTYQKAYYSIKYFK